MRNGERVDERIEEDVLYWFIHVERMENDWIAKRLYVREFTASSSAGQPRKEELKRYREGLFKKKEREVWMSGKQGEWCMIGVNGRGL